MMVTTMAVMSGGINVIFGLGWYLELAMERLRLLCKMFDDGTVTLSIISCL
jgi:hypothetical protein